mgnify:CR=1 FL=1
MNMNKTLILLFMICMFLSACAPPALEKISMATPLPPINPVKEAQTATAQMKNEKETPTIKNTPTFLTTLIPTFTPTSIPSRWATKKPGEKIYLKRIKMFTLSVGWAVGLAQPGDFEPILRTLDGGKNWRDVTPASVKNGTRVAAYFADADRAWVIYTFPQPPEATRYEQVVWRTRDGGATWTPSSPLDSQMAMESFSVRDIGFVDGKFGWTLAHLGVGMHHDYIALYTSLDGGLNWDRVLDPSSGSFPMSCYKSGVTFIDNQNGWISGSCGGVQLGYYLYRTTDGGKTWKLETIPSPAGYAGIFNQVESVCWTEPPVFPSQREGVFLLGCRLSQTETRAWLYRSTNGGLNWQPYPLPAPYGTFEFISANQGWFLGSRTGDSAEGSTIYLTVNGGQNWQIITTVNWTGQLSFVDSRNGWIVATAGDETALVRSQDSGRSWQMMTPVLIQ